ncbi:MAG: ARMT1-like domain-containing protein [Dehalococcoidia bacterium]
MKIDEECYDCLARLVRQASELATKDEALREKAITEGLDYLEREFSRDKISIEVATPLHRIVREITGNPDPYFRMKRAEIDMAARLYEESRLRTDGDLRDDIIMAVRGNIIDFFRNFEEITRDLSLQVEFAIDDTRLLEERLEHARDILYLADNTGEVFFDLNLVRRMGQKASIKYVVKEAPVQNDVTLADLEAFGLTGELPEVISTGTDTPGVLMALASDEFKSEYTRADLVLAKGMGYWETLSELPPEGKVFHLLKAKCPPVARSLGVPLDSYVALLR